MGSMIRIKTNFQQLERELLNKVWSQQNSADILQIAEDELSLRNFPDVWRQRQGTWAPLSKDYQKWKERNHPGKLKWELTGAARIALDTPANIGISGGHTSSKHIALRHSRTGIIEAEYEFKKPAAGGYFSRINTIRPIWELLPKHKAVIEKKMIAYCAGLMRKAGWGK